VLFDSSIRREFVHGRDDPSSTVGRTFELRVLRKVIEDGDLDGLIILSEKILKI
jgi:hypothetical protein